MKENYEKAALGGAVAILLGVVGVNVLGGGDELTAKAEGHSADNTTDVAIFPEVASALKGRQDDVKIYRKVKGLQKIDLFVGQQLYMKDGSNKPLSLHESEVVAHEGIPNDFWVKYGIDPTFANAGDRDFDKDGFTNREEYEAGTDPTDVDKYPSLISKLAAKDVEIFKMQMKWNAFDDKSISLRYQDNKKQSLRGRVMIGAKFFEEGGESVKGRFVLGQLQGDAYEVVDTNPLYAGTPRAKFLLPRKGDKPGGFTEVQDRSVTLALNALGKGGESFTVAQGESFAIPFDAKAKEKPYKVEKIAEKGNGYLVTISGTVDGKAETVKLTAKKR